MTVLMVTSVAGAGATFWRQYRDANRVQVDGEPKRRNRCTARRPEKTRALRPALEMAADTINLPHQHPEDEEITVTRALGILDLG